jgi:excisionase family DNA binding protein
MPDRTEGQRIFVNIEETMKLLSIGRSKLLMLTYDGSIPSLTVGRRRLYPLEGLQTWARDQVRASILEKGGNDGQSI